MRIAPMPDENRFHLAIGSRFENIELVHVVLKDRMQQLGIDKDTQHSVELAMREALANAIKHGNQQNPAKQVHVDLMVEGDELVIRVEDEGVGFDPGQVRDPLAPENLLNRNGRGILFMNKFMDNIHYGSKPDGGTVVTLRRRVPGPQTDISSEQTDPEEGTE
jgi:serine/threonine-protein kinase RsbW